MNTLKNGLFPIMVILVSLFSSVSVSAQAKALTAAELAQHEKDVSLYGEIGIAILFVVALTFFIVWKSKHDKKEREKHLEQMRKVQASKKRAA